MVHKLNMHQVLIGCLNASIKRQELKEIREVVGLSENCTIATVALHTGRLVKIKAEDLLPIDIETGERKTDLHE